MAAPPPEPTHTLYRPAVLRVEPHTIPRLRAAFSEALDLLHPHIERMRIEAMIHEDWLGDDDSIGLREFYNSQVMLSEHGPFSALVKYRDLLQHIHDQLAASEAEYRRVEGENSDLWGRA